MISGGSPTLARALARTLVALVIAATGISAAGAPTDEDVANVALDVISVGHPTPYDNYMVVICRPDKKRSLTKDTALGAFVRQLRAVKGTMAVVVAPSGYSDDPTYVVYFDGAAPVGLAMFEAGEARPTDADVAKAYAAVQGPFASRKRQAVYKRSSIQLDEGAIDVLRIVGRT